MMLLTSLSLEIAENLFLDFSRFVILIFIALRGSQSIPPHAQLWGENNSVIYHAMYRVERKEEGWGVIDQDYKIYTLTRDLLRDTTQSFSTKLIRWSKWWENELVALLHCDWIGFHPRYVIYFTNLELTEDSTAYLSIKTTAIDIISINLQLGALLLHSFVGLIFNYFHHT